ncbi:MAG: fused response regulator/phosphatase [Planctomycetes bacterium]|nr:fused response regulator/phosphatase [Planctomycetota bacterium]
MAADRILIIEDSRLHRQVLQAKLSAAGYQVETAADGESGIKQALEAPPALVITDMDMPGLSGQDVCRRLKAEDATRMVPIIMFTGNVTLDKVEQLDAGADDYLPKSSDLRELFAKVRVFLRIKHLQDQLHEQNEKLRYENEQNERELRMAREVQLGLLPREGGRRGRLQVAFRYFPMYFVGGDLFDVVESAGGTAFFISDVSGHGVSAAFVTAMIKTSVLTYSGVDLSVGDLVERVNRAISSLVQGGRFVTAFFGILDADGTKVQYVNAGHLPVLVIRAGSEQVDLLESTQLPLGVLDELIVETDEVDVKTGDRLILYTDGITEAFGPGNEQFGMERFRQTVLAHNGGDVEELVEGVVQDLVRFTGRDTFDDDVNLVACEIIEP